MSNWSEIATSAGVISLVSLTFMEIILGVDNVIFVSIITNRVSKKDQKRARNLGLIMALLIRIALLFVIQLIVRAEATLFTLPFEFSGSAISIKDLVLLAGGLFLIYKSTTEIHHKFNIDEHHENESSTAMKFSQAVSQIIIINLVFSLDSIITAIGLTSNIVIMMIAVIVSMFIMIAVSSSISIFIEKHPPVKMLALSFLLMIGVMLIAEGFDLHVPKGYIYFSMAFSLFVEMLNIKLRKKSVNQLPH